MIRIEFDMVVFKERETFVAFAPELDISSCGKTVEDARNNLKTAVGLFVEEADKMGTLKDILTEADYHRDKTGKWTGPRMIAVQSVEIT